MARKVATGKGKYEYGRRVRQSGGGGKVRGRRRVWYETPGTRSKKEAVAQRRFEEPKASKVYGPFGGVS